MSKQRFIVGNIDFQSATYNLMVALIELQQRNWKNTPNCQTDMREQKRHFNLQAGYARGYVSCLQQLLMSSSGLSDSRVKELHQYLTQAIDSVDEMLEIENDDGWNLYIQVNLTN